MKNETNPKTQWFYRDMVHFLIHGSTAKTLWVIDLCQWMNSWQNL